MGSVNVYNNFGGLVGSCPNCGKENSAFMGSTLWHHDYMCCSDKCGYAFYHSAEHQRREIEKLEYGLREIKEKLHSVRRWQIHPNKDLK